MNNNPSSFSYSDLEIFNRIRNGDQASMTILFDRYYEKLYLFAEKFTYDEDIADDVVQNVLLRIWENSHKIAIETSLKSYLFTAVKNESLKYLRKLKIRDTNDRKWCQAYIESLNFSELDVPHELLDKISKIINELPTQCREIYKLRMIYGYKYKEIATELNTTEDVVKVQIHRATKYIKSVCEDNVELMVLITYALGNI